MGGLQGIDAKKAMLFVGVMTVHSFAEGVGMGMSFGGGQSLGLCVCIAIAIHNIPEGIAVCLVLIPKGVSPFRSSVLFYFLLLRWIHYHIILFLFNFYI